MNATSSVLGSRARTTMGTLKALGQHITGIPGRKSVVWISRVITAVAAAVNTREGRVCPVGAEQLQQAIRRTAERLAHAGVAVHVEDAHGLVSEAERLAESQYIPPARSRFEQLERAGAYSVGSAARVLDHDVGHWRRVSP